MKVFHYTSGQGLFGIVNSNKLHCSNIKFMNDSSEELYAKQILEEFLHNSEKAQVLYKKFYSQSYHDVILYPGDKFVVSFCKENDSLSMWNYYASGNGYNLEFELSEIIQRNKKHGISIREIEMVYNKIDQLNLYEIFIKRFEEKAIEYDKLEESKDRVEDAKSHHEISNAQDEISELFNKELIDLLLSFKHPAYEREHEVRLIVSVLPWFMDDFDNTDFKISPNGVFIEYLTLDLDITEMLKSVTVHPLNGELHKSGVERFLLQKWMKPLDVKISNIPFRKV